MAVDARPLCVSVDAVATVIHKYQPAISPSINKKPKSQIQQLIGSFVYGLITPQRLVEGSYVLIICRIQCHTLTFFVVVVVI